MRWTISFLQPPDPRNPQPIYLQIAQEVRAAIARGALRSGDALPSIRDIAVDLGVNPNTVQQALRELERAGIVSVHRGRGCFVHARADGDDEQERQLHRIVRDALTSAAQAGLSPRALARAILREAARERRGAR